MSSTDKQSEIEAKAGDALPGITVYLGLFFVTIGTLLLQLGLTRIFSVIMYYHMAFFAVSITLFGIALGGVVVYFLPIVFRRERAEFWMAFFCLVFAGTTAYALAHLVDQKIWIHDYAGVVRRLIRLSVVLAIPFTASGIVVALALTQFPRRVHRLYGFDLAGAAAGCVLFAPLISQFGGPGFILWVVALSALAAFVFGLGLRHSAWGRITAAVLFAGFLGSCALAWYGPTMHAFTMRYARGYDYPVHSLVYDRWNSISRISVGEMQGVAEGVAKGLADQASEDRKLILIDTFAATAIIGFDGKNFSKMFYPFHDISYAAHSIFESREKSGPTRIAVIGVGGGRDILAAKAWGHDEVVGLEINPLCLDAFTREFADFAGRPLEWPGVRYVHDEARSYLTRTDEDFDLIQASLIDTFAATSAGAFVLSENSLYTIEGWNIFLSKLKTDGMISMTRWYSPGTPVESIRLLSLARASLEAHGIKDPGAHLLMSRMIEIGNPESQPMATLVVKKSPFTQNEITQFTEWTRDNQFQLLLAPGHPTAPELEGVLNSPTLEEYVRTHPFRIDPPTDDQPFFFDVLRWRDVFQRDIREGSDYISAINFKPIVMLATTLAVLAVMCLVFIIVPFVIEGWLQRDRAFSMPWTQRAGIVIYFVMLGLGYMMVELSLIQRFAIFLGHPSYSLTACLASMLLSSGVGSMFTDRFFGMKDAGHGAGLIRRANFIVVGLLVVTWLLASLAWAHGAALSTPVRIALTALIIAPPAFFMGMAFPLAMKASAFRSSAPLGWYWGINGAFSVCASVLTVIIAHQSGLRFAFGCGVACYLLAAVAAKSFAFTSRENSN